MSVAAIVLFAAGFISLCLAVLSGATRDIDRATLSFVQSFSSPALDLFASLITVTGRAEIAALLACVLAFFWVRREGASGLAPLALFAAILIEALLKYAVPHTPPPSSALRDLNILQFIRSDAPYAFPSGHVTRTTLLSVLIAERVPASRPILAVYVATMCITRLYVGAHWSSDVAGGLLLGATIALAATPIAAGAGRALATLRR